MNVIENISRNVLSLDGRRPRIIAIDGVDGSGKTLFSQALFKEIKKYTSEVFIASVDGFHNPREMRYRKGRSSPEGFYSDSYDYTLLKKTLLDPFKGQGKRLIKTKAFDLESNARIDNNEIVILGDGILIFEGIFLHRPELISYWDYSIFLSVEFANTYSRMSIRDGCPSNPLDEANKRYYDGQKLYLNSVNPEMMASVVIDNNDFKNPFIKIV